MQIIDSKEFGDSKFANDLKEIYKSIGWDREVFYIHNLNFAVKDNKSLGFISYKVKPPYLFIERLAVKQEFQKQGIGFKLMKHIIDEAKENNCDIISLISTSNARNFYLNKVTRIDDIDTVAHDGYGFITYVLKEQWSKKFGRLFLNKFREL